jgi:hypothetical protein
MINTRPKPPTLYPIMVSVSPEWARMLTRLQQLEKQGVRVLIDLEAMTLQVVGRQEHLAPKAESVLNSPS